jgi:hypothetical protein
MIKNMGLLAKRADVSVELFHSHWRDVHGPLALRISAIRRYVQSHRLRDGVGGLPRLPQEGIAEVWVDDLATAIGLSENPEFTRDARPDEAIFMDRSSSAGMKCEERVVIPGPSVDPGDPGVKAFLFLTARHDQEDRLARWLSDDLESCAEALPAVRRLSVDRQVADAPRRAPYAAAVEISWPDIASYDRAWSSAAATDLRRSLDDVVDLPASAGTLVEEYRLKW